MFECKNILFNDFGVGWDGIVWVGEMLNVVVFVYMVEICFIDGEMEVFSGDVILLC